MATTPPDPDAPDEAHPPEELGRPPGDLEGPPEELDDPALAAALEKRRRLLHRLSVALFAAAGVLVVVAVLGVLLGGRHHSKGQETVDQTGAGAAAGPAGGSSATSATSATSGGSTPGAGASGSSQPAGSVDPHGSVTDFGGTMLASGPFAGFGEVAATVRSSSGDVTEPCLLAAIDEPHRERGLMTVTDTGLDGHTGMVFVFPAAQHEPFWMRNTPMALSIAFYGADGRFVSSTDMAPCADSPDCPNYAAAGAYTMAVEVPQGQLAARGFGPGSVLHLTGACDAGTGRGSAP